MPQISKIRIARLKCGIKQWEMAKLLGLSETLLSKYETGRLPTPPEVLERIKSAFGSGPGGRRKDGTP